VLEHISMITSVKGMAVTQHKIVRIPDMLIAGEKSINADKTAPIWYFFTKNLTF